MVAQLANIGDMVFVTPLLGAVRRLWPAAQITVVGMPGPLEVLEDHPAVDARLPYDKRHSHRGAGGFVRVGSVARESRPDVFFGVTRSARTALLGLLTGADVRVGFREPGRRWAYTHLAQRPNERSFAERPLALLDTIGQPADSTPPEIFVSAARRDAARERLGAAGWTGGRLLAIAPGARKATKRWPIHNYARFVDLAREQGFASISVYGGPTESGAIDALTRDRPWLIRREPLSVGDMVAEIAVCSAVVASDSGPLHAARALGIPSVMLIGPTPVSPLVDGRSAEVARYPIDCHPCSPSGDDVCPLEHHDCMKKLTPETVLEHLERAL